MPTYQNSRKARERELSTLPENQRTAAEEFLRDIQEGKESPVVFAEKILGLKLHAGQVRWLEETLRPNRKKNILVPGNRFGKTFITAVKHIWMDFYKIGLTADVLTMRRAKYRTINLAAHSEQAKIGANYIKQILSSSFVYWYEGRWVVNKCRIEGFLPPDGIVESPNHVYTFNNGSQYISRTISDDRGGAVQGGACHYMSYDECCRSMRLEDEIEPDLLPRLIDTDGSLDLLSTPDKDSTSLQYYYELCEMGKEGIDGWYTQEGSTEENTFIPPASHARAQQNITDPQVRSQVLSGNFVFSGGRMFSGASIKNIWQDITWAELPLTMLSVGKVYGKQSASKVVWGWDFARSESGDATVGYAVDSSRLPYEIVCGVRMQGVPVTTQVRDIQTLVQYYSGRLGIDSSSMGGAFLLDLLAGMHPEGFDFKGKLKGEMLFLLKKALDDGKIIGPKPTMENTLYYLRRELGAYKEEDKKLKTDTVMALGIAIYLITASPPARMRPIKMFRRM